MAPRPRVALSFVRLLRLMQLPACGDRYLDLPGLQAYIPQEMSLRSVSPKLPISFLPVAVDERSFCVRMTLLLGKSTVLVVVVVVVIVTSLSAFYALSSCLRETLSERLIMIDRHQSSLRVIHYYNLEH